ncbi:MAG: extracellular solute-binding protein [Lactobacillus sp.]|nr:extracellular solute-binding protein [Lactobacillus sp.]
MKKLSKILLLLLVIFSLTACGKNNHDQSTSKVQTKITKKTTIVFWHAMTGYRQNVLAKLTKEFEKENPKINVKLQSQGTYPDLQAKVDATLSSKKDLPNITQAYPDGLIDAEKNNYLVDLGPYLKNQKVDIASAFMKGARINGKQYGLPFNKSVEVLFYNKTLLKKYGVKVPTTMAELKTAAETIYKKSKGKVVGAGFDSLSNYYMLALKNAGIDFSKNVDFTSQTSRKIINYYYQGVQKGYFRIAGTDKYLSYPFDNSKIAMFIGTSATEGYIKMLGKKTLNYGVVLRPGKYTVGQGADLYMLNKGNSNDKAASFLYMKFLTRKDSQLLWANSTGYLPVNNQALNNAKYLSSGYQVPLLATKALKHTYSLPVVENSDNAYNELTPIFENILTAKPSKLEQMIQDGKTKLKNTWKD